MDCAMKAVTLSTIEMLFSMNAGTSSVQDSYKSVISWRSESRRIFNSDVPE
jgi:hypothetical protein